MGIKIPKTPPALTPGKKLNIAFEKQEKTFWCWATCSRMVARHLGNHTQTQCEIVNIGLGKTDCCQSGNCNRGIPMNGSPSVVDTYGSLKIKHVLHSTPISFPALKASIDSNSPVEVSWYWPAPQYGGHLVLVYGWSVLNGTDVLLVFDPDQGNTVLNYTELVSARGAGTWREALTDFEL